METCYDFVLYDAPGRLSTPAWSPDGRTIVVVERPSTGQPDYRLWQLSMNASGERGQDMFAGGYPAAVSSALAFSDPYHLGYPAWATNGQALLIEMKASRFAPTRIARLVRTGAASWSLGELGGGSDVYGRQPVVMQVSEVGASCPTVVMLDGAESAAIREMPNLAGSVLATVLDGDSLTLLGIYSNGGNLQDTWFRVYVPGGASQGWIRADLVFRDPVCIDSLPPLDQNGVPIPPPPPIPTDSCVGLPVDGTQTNIRNIPSTSGSQIIATFSGGYWVRVLGRYIVGTPQRHDDWYLVSLESENGTIEGWSAAVATATTPLYGDLCTRLPVTDSPIEPIAWRDPMEAEILRMPATYPDVMTPLYQSAPGSRLPVDELRISAPFNVFPSSDEMEIRLTQGYGLTEFAYLFPGTYASTNQIHSGLDFFGVNDVIIDGCLDTNGNPSNTCISVRSVCDGEIVRTSGSGGSNSGGGITIRCDMPDGSPSNVFLTYNHLKSDMVTEDFFGRRVQTAEELGLNVYQYEVNGIIVAPHLHLEAFFRSPEASEQLRLNPLLLFGTNTPGIELFYTPRTGIPEDEQPFDYYPVDSVTDRGEIRAYEWSPPDQEDPSDRTTSRSYSALEDDYTEQDYDLAIPVAQNNEWAVLGDGRGSLNSQPWDRLVGQNGSPFGIQDITNTGIEWPGGVTPEARRLVLSIADLVSAMRELVP